MDFDTPLPPPRENARLPEGDCSFEIVEMKKNRRHVGKLGEVNIAELHLLVTPADGSGTRKLTQELKLHEDLAWILYPFAASIGQYQHGDKTAQFRIDWSRVPGSSGYATLKHRAYKNKEGEDRVAVDVDKWLDPQGRAGANDKPREIKIGSPEF